MVRVNLHVITLGRVLNESYDISKKYVLQRSDQKKLVFVFCLVGLFFWAQVFSANRAKALDRATSSVPHFVHVRQSYLVLV